MDGRGRWCRGEKRPTLDDTKKVDIRAIRREGRLVPGAIGSISWSKFGEMTGSINYKCFRNFLLLIYSYSVDGRDEETVTQEIPFDRTPCNFGGERLWFICPQCERRIDVLCANGIKFYCRHCYRLPYTCQHENGIARLLYRSQSLREKMFENIGYGERGSKKRNMQQKTFDRLLVRYERIEAELDAAIISSVGALELRQADH